MKAVPKRTIKATKSERAAPALTGVELWQLRLYVAGQTPKSLTAFANLKRICEEHIRDRYTIEVIDLIEQPRLAKEDQILAIPTVVRKLPAPTRKIIGDLSNTERALGGMDLQFDSNLNTQSPLAKAP